MEQPKDQDPDTVVPANKKLKTLEGGNSGEIGGMWNLKHKISSTTRYELLINTYLKGDTSLNLNNFYNHIKMCLNAETRFQWDVFPTYQSIKIHSNFE